MRFSYIFYTYFIIFILDVTLSAQSALTADITHVFSENCMDGHIDLHINEGCPNYTVKWFLNGSQWGSTITTTGLDGLEDLHNVPKGNWNVEVVDALCGKALGKFIIGVSPGLVNIVDIQNNTSCQTYQDRPGYIGSGDGFIDIEVNYNSVFSLKWSGPNGFMSSNQDIKMLCPGTYTLMLTNQAGCVYTQNVTICCCADGNRMNPVCEMSGSIPLCEDGITFPLFINSGSWESPNQTAPCDGYIKPIVSGGGSNIAYQWTYKPPGGIATPFGSNHKLQNLCAGEYCLTVKDGCSTDNKCWILVDCSQNSITLSGQVTNACTNHPIGAINLSITGGTSPLSFMWSNGSNTEDLNSLTGGQYCVTVSDKNHCMVDKCFTVLSPNAIHQPSFQPCGTSIICNGQQIDFIPIEPVDRIVNFIGYEIIVGQNLFFAPTKCVIDRSCNGFFLGRFEEPIHVNVDHDPNSDECLVTARCGETELFTFLPGQIDPVLEDPDGACKDLCHVELDPLLFGIPFHLDFTFGAQLGDDYDPVVTYTCFVDPPNTNQTKCRVLGYCREEKAYEKIEGCLECDSHNVEPCCRAQPEGLSGVNKVHQQNNTKIDTNFYLLPHNDQHLISNSITDFVVFPNPVTSDFTISFKHHSNQPYKVVLKNSLGYILWSDNFPESTHREKILSCQAINVSSGLYFIELITAGELLAVEKILVIQ